MITLPSGRCATCVRTLFLFTLAAIAGSVAAAPRTSPPLDLLHAQDNWLVAGRLAEVVPGRLVFERAEVLSGKGEPPERVDVRAPVLQRAPVTGTAYIFGYTAVHRDKRLPGMKAGNAEGAVLLSSTGLEPALFADTPALREILRVGHTVAGRQSRGMLDLLLAALAGEDAALRDLAAAQIAMEPRIGKHLRRGDRMALEQATRDGQLAPDTRSTLLLAAATRPGALGGWWKDVATDVVTSTPTGGYSRETPVPVGIVLTAFEVLDMHAVKLAPESISRWLRSPERLLVERAGSTLRRESPALERTATEQALADPALPEATRRYLVDHLRRLDRAAGGKDARKDGPN
jgi:hypothetical protein